MNIISDNLITNPLVSVVVVTYNQEKTIAHTIDSILAQDCDFPFEIIIGEDCGTDRTRDICFAYQKNHSEIISLILQERNKGIVGNYIDTVLMCKGKFIAACAGDDYWQNTKKLQLQVDYLEANPDCGIVHTDYDRLHTYSNKLEKAYNKKRNTHIPQGYVQKDIFTGRLRIQPATACFRKDLFINHIPYEKYIELNFPVEDWPTWLILSKYTQVHYLPDSTITYRHGHESLSNLKNYDKMKQKYLLEKKMYKFICELFPDELDFDEAGYDNYVRSIILSLAYKKFDYSQACNVSRQMENSGNKDFKILMASNWLTFICFATVKKVKTFFFENQWLSCHPRRK